jgi:hypothetical protein
MNSGDISQIKALLTTHCVIDSNGCWLWSRSYRGKGYAQLTLSGRRQVQGNRAAFFAFNGEIPAGQWVLHKCDVPACCNPEHLFLGTAKDNTMDCVAKGRLRPQFGGLASRRIQVSEYPTIFAMYEHGNKQQVIADKYGVTQVCISQILLGKRRVHHPAS